MKGEAFMTKYWRTVRSRFTVGLVVGAFLCAVAVGALAQVASKSSLIGKLEGPEVVTDPAKFPRTFNEAPQLAAMVKAGKLPPVKDRLPAEPLVGGIGNPAVRGRHPSQGPSNRHATVAAAA